MCGRTCITVRCEEITNACCYKRKNETKYSKPAWRDEYNLGKKFTPSTNTAPTDVTPVLVPAINFKNVENEERIIKPMMWGMIPRWLKGDYKKNDLSTINCRSENILQSKLYGKPFKEGKRCVIVADGFYEWRSADKQPYFIHSQQNHNIKIYDSVKSNFDEISGWNGKTLLKMAGVYDVWNCEEGDIFSYSIITIESGEKLKWLHHRMPAILETDDEITRWLDVENISYNEAISLFKPASNILWYPVSKNLNNSKNKSEECNKPVDAKGSTSKAQKVNVGSSNLMSSWLKRGSSSTANDSEPLPKIHK